MNYRIALLLVIMLSAAAWRQSATVKRREATLAEQKMCSQQAAKVDAKERNEWGTLHHALIHTYTSHYDSSANVC